MSLIVNIDLEMYIQYICVLESAGLYVAFFDKNFDASKNDSRSATLRYSIRSSGVDQRGLWLQSAAHRVGYVRDKPIRVPAAEMSIFFVLIGPCPYCNVLENYVSARHVVTAFDFHCHTR